MRSPRLVCHENLECLLGGSRRRLRHAICVEAAAYPLYQASLPPGCLLPYGLTRPLRPFLNDDDVIQHSDLTAAMTRAGATGFIPSYRSSALLERWGQDGGFALLSPRHDLQRALEDKIRFHGLMEQHGLPVPAGFALTRADQIAQLPRFPLVCQQPAGEGMEGTFLVGSRREFRAQLAAGTLALPLLCRQFLRGTTLGITLVVGARELLLSAARVQCRRLHHRDQDLAGVQWVPLASFSPRQRRTIARVMSGLGRALRQAGLRGQANVDFILRGDQVYIIECNPRFSSSTPLLSLQPELLHGLDFMQAYLRAVRGASLGAHRPSLPPSRHEGAYIDFSDWAKPILKAARRRVVQAMPALGVHELVGADLRFVSPNIAALQGGQRLLFHYATPAGTRLGARSDLGSVLANFPLFSLGRGRSALTRRGRAVLQQLAGQVRLARPNRTLAELIGARKEEP